VETSALDPIGPPDSLDRKTMVVFISATLLLVVFNYWGLPSRFAGTTFHEGVADFLGDGYRPYFLLLPYQFWGLSSLVIRFLAPMAIIVFILREQPRDWGFQLKGQWKHLRPYVWFLAAMVPVLFLASAMPAFQAKYPLYQYAIAGGWNFWGWQLFYGMQFLGLEAFFRGFLVFGLYPKLGAYAVPVMVIPYTMVHFGKPAPETFAAVLAGFILGYLALKSRSFLWGWMLHWGVAITMDLLVIGREFGFSNIVPVIF
jgi:membrane protease YdiL (CAAX protease family)